MLSGSQRRPTDRVFGAARAGMAAHLEALLREAVAEAVAAGGLAGAAIPPIVLAPPVDPSYGDLACDVAMELARAIRRPPQEVAALILERLHDPQGLVAAAEVAGPGFVNLRLAPAFWRAVLAEALAAGERYGRPRAEGRGTVQVEFSVPDGASLGLEGARGAVVADATARLLAAAGYVIERACVARDGGRLDAALADLGRLGVRFDRVVTDAGAGRFVPGAWVVRRPGAVHMSAPACVRVTRHGELVASSLRAMLDEVGPDAVRFFLLLGPVARPLDVDLALAGRSGTDNPLFYVAYARRRIARVVGAAEAAGIRIDPAPDLEALGGAEMEALRLLARHPDAVEEAVRACEPHRLVVAALELAAAFHRYYNRHRILTEDPARTQAQLALLRCVDQALGSACALAGVSAPLPT